MADRRVSRSGSIYVQMDADDVARNSPAVPLNAVYKRNFLPFLRYVVLASGFLVLDVVSAMVLWLSGVTSQEFVDGVTKFTFLHSVFDLALLAVMRGLLLTLLLQLLEKTTLGIIDSRSLQMAKLRRKKVLHTFIPVMTFGFLVYGTVKGGTILYTYINDTSYSLMKTPWMILVITSFVFPYVEFGGALYSKVAMSDIPKLRIIRYFNADKVELDKNGEVLVKPKPVDLRRVLALVLPDIWLVLVGTLCLFVSSGSMMVAPLFFGKVIDAASKSMDQLNKTVLVLFFIFAVGAVASTFRAWLFVLAGQRVVARLRVNLFKIITNQEIAFFDVTRTGELTNRLSSDTQVVQNALTVNISMLARNLLQLIGSLVFMFSLNASLAGVLLAVVPVVSVVAVRYGKYVQKVRKNFQDRLADASTTAEESISSMRTVRSFTAEGKMVKRYSEDIDKSYKQGKKLAMGEGFFNGLVGILCWGAICLVLWYGGKLLNDKEVTVGLLTSFLFYTLNVAMAFMAMSALFGDFMQAVGASERIFNLLDRQPSIPNSGGVKCKEPMVGEIELEDVSFTYPSRPDTTVLKGVSLTVRPGQVAALVGPSGGGKSTIVHLIQRFYDIDSGTIKLDGLALPDLDPSSFRKRMAVVSQEPILFGTSIRDNIAFGEEATDEEIAEAAKLANAHEFIDAFPEKYDTLVGERGIRLSGGQKQRVAIARALIKNPRLLLLDEATSALDAESERLVQEAIDRAMTGDGPGKGRTVLVIAHRLSTVRNASCVFVVDKGQIVEQGTHDELIKREDSVYKRLVLHQLTAGGATDEMTLPNMDEVVLKGRRGTAP